MCANGPFCPIISLQSASIRTEHISAESFYEYLSCKIKVIYLENGLQDFIMDFSFPLRQFSHGVIGFYHFII